MKANPKPIFLKEALESGDEDALFCIYKCIDGELSSKTVKAKEASEMLDTGDYYDNPTSALSHDDDSCMDDEPIAQSDPEPDIDKRSKEYREWKERNQKDNS